MKAFVRRKKVVQDVFAADQPSPAAVEQDDSSWLTQELQLDRTGGVDQAALCKSRAELRAEQRVKDLKSILNEMVSYYADVRAWRRRSMHAMIMHSCCTARPHPMAAGGCI